MRHLIALLFATTIGLSGTAQSLKFAAQPEGKYTRVLPIETPSFSGSLSSTNTTLTLVLTNKTSKVPITSEMKVSLRDISMRGIQLCPKRIISLEPNVRQKVLWVNCNERRGLFFLDLDYPTKKEMKDASLFLRQKEWTLSIQGEEFSFFSNL